MHRKNGETRSSTKDGDSLAQLVEHNTFNVGVLGSSPRRITEQIGKTPQIAETKTVSAIFVIPLSGKITHIVRFSSEQIVNSFRREQFCSRFQIDECNCLIFCVFLRFAVHKVGLSYACAGSEPHFRLKSTRNLTLICSFNFYATVTELYLTYSGGFERIVGLD